jgi:tRNA(Arg) A34 adenosine deaminase TadA
MDWDEPQPFSAQEYFSILLRRARAAEAEGNYAIAAAATVCHQGLELLALAGNSLFAGHDPLGHAEANAIAALRGLAVAGDDLDAALTAGQADGSLLIRRAPDDRTESALYTTLEPCPMCTVCIINAGIDRVVVAAEDPPSGSLAPERLGSLPALWPELAKGLDVVWAQSEDPDSLDSYLPSLLRRELVEVFLDSRARLDGQLSRQGALDLHALGASVAATRGDIASAAQRTAAGSA